MNSNGSGGAGKSQLQYAKPDQLKIHRHRRGKSFSYTDDKNHPIKNATTLARIKHLALPPAWEEVRISSSPKAHLQAIGRDQRGRWQYKYHEKWHAIQNETKFHRLVEFAKHLPAIRRRIKSDLDRKDFSREKVLAAAVDVLQKTNIRVGNIRYSEMNNSYGLTTLKNKHAEIKGEHIKFHFRAKSGKIRDVDFDDKVLSKILTKCRNLPGQDLFCYREPNGKIHNVSSTDVNSYIDEISGAAHFTAKDFRLWCGTSHALQILRNLGPVKERLAERAWRKRHLEVVRATAEYLGNTPAICEKYYIHPQIFEADRTQSLFRRKRFHRIAGLNSLECATLGLINKT